MWLSAMFDYPCNERHGGGFLLHPRFVGRDGARMVDATLDAGRERRRARAADGSQPLSNGLTAKYSDCGVAAGLNTAMTLITTRLRQPRSEYRFDHQVDANRRCDGG